MSEFEPIVSSIQHLLAGERYDDLVRLCKGRSPAASELKRAIDEYQGKIVVPPSTSILDVVRITDSKPPCWCVVVPLHTEEEGRSDLSLELTITEDPIEGMLVQIDGIHAL